MIKEQWKIYKEEIREALKDLRTKGRRARQIPNILTSLRLFAPCFILPASFFGNIPLVIGFVTAFSITDMLDGFIARTFHFTSKLGKDLDAFCDKVFAGTLLLAASFLKPIMLVNFSLEAMIAAVNVNATLKGKEAKSLYIGKAKTAFLFPLLGLSLISNVALLDKVFKVLFVATTGLQVLTAVSYVKKYQEIEPLTEVDDSNTEFISLEDSPKEEKNKSKKKELGELKPTQTSQNIRILKDMKELLLKETKPIEEEKKKENIKK